MLVNQYRIAEKHLNIISNMQSDQTHQEEVKHLKLEIEKRNQAFEAMAQQLNIMQENVNQLMTLQGVKEDVEPTVLEVKKT